MVFILIEVGRTGRQVQSLGRSSAEPAAGVYKRESVSPEKYFGTKEG